MNNSKERKSFLNGAQGTFKCDYNFSNWVLLYDESIFIIANFIPTRFLGSI